MRDEIQAFFEQGGDFGSMALRLHAWQRAHNPQYDRFCGDARPERWQDIPAVPVSLFRDVSLTSFELSQAQAVFHTSGTTSGRPGRIHLLETGLYERGARLHAERCLGPLPTVGVSLVSEAPTSSLGHMCRSFVPGMPSFFSLAHGVDAPGAWQALATLAAQGAPLFVPCTAFALADLLDHTGPIVPLPAGSIVMVTGGFKGRRSAVDEHSLLHALAERMPGARLVGEYGMSELCSQLWATPAGSAFAPPPWMRIMAVDPWTGQPADTGLLRFFDLANVDTVLAIETSDVGTVHPDGRVSLSGRLAGARPRGCSLTVEEAHGR